MTTSSPLDIRTFTAAGFGENAYLVRCKETDTLVAIDPGGEAARMAAEAEAAGGLDAIYLTHAHLDHIEGVGVLVDATGAPVHMHPADRGLYEGAPQQAAMFGMQIGELPPVDHELEPGKELRFGACAFEVRFAPGHSPGHVILYCADAAVAFVGDVVFQGSIGRTDLPGGDFQTLMESIKTQVLTLPDATVLYTGHGPSTTVRDERDSNPFLIPLRGERLA